MSGFFSPAAENTSITSSPAVTARETSWRMA
jgi:hypothetical protein